MEDEKTLENFGYSKTKNEKLLFWFKSFKTHSFVFINYSIRLELGIIKPEHVISPYSVITSIELPIDFDFNRLALIEDKLFELYKSIY